MTTAIVLCPLNQQHSSRFQNSPTTASTRLPRTRVRGRRHFRGQGANGEAHALVRPVAEEKATTAAVRAFRPSFVWSLATLALPRPPHSTANQAVITVLAATCSPLRLVTFFSACLSPLQLLLINSCLSRAVYRSHSRIVCGEGLADVGGYTIEGVWRTFIK